MFFVSLLSHSIIKSESSFSFALPLIAILTSLGLATITQLSKKQYRKQKWSLLKQVIKSKFAKKGKGEGSLIPLLILLLLATIAILWILWEIGGIFALILGIVGAIGGLVLILKE